MRLNIPQPIYPTALRLRCLDDVVNGGVPQRPAGPADFSFAGSRQWKKLQPLARNTGKVLPIVTAASSPLASLPTWAYMVAADKLWTFMSGPEETCDGTRNQ
jgi:hypothetical protein